MLDYTDRLKATEKDGEVKPSKYGIGDVNLAIKTGWCPIHFAAAGEHQVTSDVHQYNNYNVIQ